MMVMEIINKVVMASLHANNSQPVKDRAENQGIKNRFSHLQALAFKQKTLLIDIYSTEN